MNQADMAALSACNIQPLEFIVINEKETVRRIKEPIAENGNYNAPQVIVVRSTTEFITWGARLLAPARGVSNLQPSFHNPLIQ